jgi:hypothetical protein
LSKVAAFERIKPELLKKYKGRCVAIAKGKVVEVGDEKMKVLEQVRKRLGSVPVYVQWVGDRCHQR